jgi:hypothetical protein
MKSLKILVVLALTILLPLSCDKATQSHQDLVQTKFDKYTATENISGNALWPSQNYSLKITQDFDLGNLPPVLAAIADSLREVQFLNFSDQKDEFKYNLSSAPGTLVKLMSSDQATGARTFQSIASVLKETAKTESRAPQNSEVDEQVLDKSRKFELKFVIGEISLKDQERYQFLKQDILFSSISDAAVDPNAVSRILKLNGMDSDVNRYWVITEAILQSYTYKKFQFKGKEGRIRLPIGTSTIDSDNGTYEQMNDFKSKLVVRLVVRPAIAFRPL